MVSTVALPWPSKYLNPNSRTHNKVKMGYVKMARDLAYYTALSEVHVNLFTPDDRLALVVVAHPPDRRKRDLDNVLSMCKAYQDGLCQALGINDAQIQEVRISWGNVVHGGQVVMTLARIGG